MLDDINNFFLSQTKFFRIELWFFKAELLYIEDFHEITFCFALVQVCVSRLNDIQLALVIARLFENNLEESHRKILTTYVLGYEDEEPCTGMRCFSFQKPHQFLQKKLLCV